MTLLGERGRSDEVGRRHEIGAVSHLLLLLLLLKVVIGRNLVRSPCWVVGAAQLVA